jgi:hypothetical protein
VEVAAIAPLGVRSIGGRAFATVAATFTAFDFRPLDRPPARDGIGQCLVELCNVVVEYMAYIEEDDYEAFRGILGGWLPAEYEMWLRVRDRGRLRLLTDGAAVEEITVFRSSWRFAISRDGQTSASTGSIALRARKRGM